MAIELYPILGLMLGAVCIAAAVFLAVIGVKGDATWTVTLGTQISSQFKGVLTGLLSVIGFWIVYVTRK